MLESGGIKQAAKLFFRSLKASRAAEHIQVAHRLLPVFVADARKFRHYSFDQQQFPVLGQRSAAIFKNFQAALIVPIVNDTFHDDGICAGGDRLEEITRQKFGATTEAHAIQMADRRFQRTGEDRKQSPGCVGIAWQWHR